VIARGDCIFSRVVEARSRGDRKGKGDLVLGRGDRGGDVTTMIPWRGEVAAPCEVGGILVLAPVQSFLLNKLAST
jgi:hypothetical protein